MKNGFSLSLLPPPPPLSLFLSKHTIEIVHKLLIPSLVASLHVNDDITKLGIKIILPYKYEFTHKNQIFFNYGNKVVVSVKELIYSVRSAFKEIL